MAIIACPACGRRISDRAPACTGCGLTLADREAGRYEPQTKPTPAPTTRPDPGPPDALDCPACGGAGAMAPGRVARFGLAGRVMGVLVGAPSLLAAVLGALMGWNALRANLAAAGRLAEGPASGRVLGVLAGSQLGLGAGLVVLAMGVGGLLIAWLLTSRRKAWRCTRCGHHLPRA